MLISEIPPFALNPNEADTKLVSFLVPQMTLAGRYEITYVIRDRKYPSIRDFYTTYVTVLPIIKLQAKLLESPQFVIAGEEYQSSFVITNQGNTEYGIDTEIISGEDVPYVADAETFTLAPGQSKTVLVDVKTDAKITKKLRHRLQLIARVSEDSRAKMKAESASWVEILPKISGVEDNFHRIPAELTFRYVSQENQDDRTGFQTEFRGEGTLDEEGKRHIKFHFRGPDIQDKSVFGERDEYTLGYWTKEHELYFGDRTYSVSSLTERYLYGRGLEGKLHIDDNFSLGAYHMRTRWLEPGTEETAAYMDYSIDDKYKLGLNYLRKLRDSKLSNIVSVEGELKPFRSTRVELEYALVPDSTGKDNAYLTRLYGSNDWFKYYFKLTRAGADYPGYYSDLEYVSGGITLPIDRRLRLHTSFRREKNNLDLDPLLLSAPLEKYHQLGLDYKLKSNTTFSFDWLSRDRRDRLDSPIFDYQEDTLRFGIGQSFDRLSFRSSAELGKTQNDLDNTTSSTERYTASVYFKPDIKQSYSGYLYYDKDSDFTGENRRSTTFGLNARYKIANRTSLSLFLQTNNDQGSSRGDRDNLEVRLSHSFINDNKLSILARQTRYKNSGIEDDTALMVQYTIPLGLPVCKKKSVGSIRGYIYDEEMQTAIAGVILRLNDLTAVTDEGGNFTFPSLKPGTYYLDADTASIGMNRIPNLKTPIALAVKGGEQTLVNIPVTRAAWLSGRIMVYGYENNNYETVPGEKYRGTGESYVVENGSDAKLIEDYALANVILEIKNISEKRRTITDRQGQFNFQELRPGEWTLKIYSYNLPEYHYLEKDSFEMELKAGQRREMLIKVLPKKRRIRIIAEPQTLLEEEQK